MADIVQVKNPRTGYWTKIDKDKGQIIGSKKTKWAGVRVAVKRKKRRKR